MGTKFNVPLYLSVISANLLSYSSGSCFSWPSPVFPKLKSLEGNPLGIPISVLEETWIISSLPLAAAFSTLVTGICSDKFGKKATMLAFALPLLAAHVIIVFATKVELYYLARILMGIGCGCCFSVVPMYVGEISEKNNRGLLGCLMSFWLTTGTLSSYIIGPYTSIRTLSLIAMVPLVLFIGIFGIFVPESPYYYIMVKKPKKALVALTSLRTDDEKTIASELEEIQRTVDDSQKSNKTFSDIIKTKSLKTGLGITLGLMFLQQFSGIAIVIGYMQMIFGVSGSRIPPETSSIIIGSIQVIVSLVTTQLVDRLGRRILLIGSMFGISLSLATLGIYYYLHQLNYNLESIFWLPIACLIAFTVMYNSGIGPLAWSIMGELFPPEVKGIASTVTSFFSLILSFTTSAVFPNVVVYFGIAWGFWIFAVISGLGAIFVFFVVPETKGKSLQEIQAILINDNGRI